MNIFDAMKGFVIYHCLYVGIKTNIFEHIYKKNNSGTDALEIANSLGLNCDYVQIWLNTAIAFDIIYYEDGKCFVKENLYPFILDKTDIRYQGELIRIFIDHLSGDMKKQPDYMKSGERFVFSDHNDEFVELIARRGHLRAKTFISNFLENHQEIEILFKTNSTIIDIGCGSGSFLKCVQSTYQNPSYIGIDEDKKSINIAKTDQNEKLSFFLGRIEDIELTTKVDCIIMVLALHEINDSHRADVLKKCHNQLKDGGHLLIMEFPYPENTSDFSDSKYLMGTLDQYFEMIWGTKHIGWAAQEALISNAGYKDIKRIFLNDGIYMVISATKSG